MKYKIKINQRDVEILKFLHTSKVLSRKLISEYFFNGSIRASNKRILKLRREGLIAKINRISEVDSYSLYQLTPRGFKYVQKDIENEVGSKLLSPRYKSDSIDHDLGLVRISRHLNEGGFTQRVWLENQIQSYPLFEESDYIDFKMKRFDMVIESLNSNGDESITPLEFERSVKDPYRYVDRLSEIYNDEYIPLVLTVCSNKTVLKAIKRSEAQIINKPEDKLYYILLDHLLESAEKIIFESCSGDKIEIFSQKKVVPCLV